MASEVVDPHGERFVLAPHMATALLDKNSPAYMAGPFLGFECPEIFDRFSDRFATGQRTWWDESTPEFITAVARSGRPFYVRLVPGGLERVPGLGERLEEGARILDLACGAGFGLVRLAHTYPSSRLVGVDGDAHSLGEAARQLADEGLTDRVELAHSATEDIAWIDQFDLVISNIAMHECRDIEKTTANVHRALRPRGGVCDLRLPLPRQHPRAAHTGWPGDGGHPVLRGADRRPAATRDQLPRIAATPRLPQRGHLQHHPHARGHPRQQMR